MSFTNITPSHFLFVFPRPAWGHIRPCCALATHLVCEQEDIIVTFIVAPPALDKTRTEVSRQFFEKPSENSKACQRIRILSPCPSYSVGPVEFGMKVFGDAYPVAYRTLYEAKSVTCSVTGTLFDAVAPPCAVILDYFALPQLHATRTVSGHSVPIIACMSAGAAAMIRFFGPESIGGVGDIGARIDAEVARTGLSANEIGHKIYNHTEGKPVQIAGLPAMYDYEFFPQMIPLDRPVHYYVIGGYNLFRECDAIIVTTSYAYESVSLDTMKQWLSDIQKEVHVLGPLLPVGGGFGTDREEGASVDIETFLGEMLVQHGKRSVFLVSFGTINWPSVSEYVDELIDALIEKKAPFILALSSPRAKISEQQAEKIKSSGLGMSTTWSPQQFILNHQATGWFITHGGFNSVTESLGSGIPLICWPFSFDQPVAAAHVTENLNIAFELFQVRTGQGLKGPVARNGLVLEGTRHAVGIEIQQTIDLCRSEKGQELRSNAEKIKVKINKAWEEDGAARQEIRNFLHKYI